MKDILFLEYIYCLWVAGSFKGKGIGKELLDYVKGNNSELFLQVYKKNVRAVDFYLREDFVVSKEQIDEFSDIL